MPIDERLYDEIIKKVKKKDIASEIEADKIGFSHAIIKDRKGKAFYDSQREAEEAFNELLACCAKAKSVDKAADLLSGWKKQKDGNYKDYIEEEQREMNILRTKLCDLADQTARDLYAFKKQSQTEGVYIAVIDEEAYDNICRRVDGFRDEIGKMDIPDTADAYKYCEELKGILDNIRKYSTSAQNQLGNEMRTLDGFRRKLDDMQKDLNRGKLDGKRISEKDVARLGAYVDAEHNEPTTGSDDLSYAVYVTGTIAECKNFIKGSFATVSALFGRMYSKNDDQQLKMLNAQANDLYARYKNETNAARKAELSTILRDLISRIETRQGQVDRNNRERRGFLDNQTRIHQSIIDLLDRVIDYLNNAAMGSYKDYYEQFKLFGLKNLNDIYEEYNKAINSGDKDKVQELRTKLNAAIETIKGRMEIPDITIESDDFSLETDGNFDSDRNRSVTDEELKKANEEFIKFFGEEPKQPETENFENFFNGEMNNETPNDSDKSEEKEKMKGWRNFLK